MKTQMPRNPLLEAREVLKRAARLTHEQHRRDVLSQAAVFKAALAQIEAVQHAAEEQGRAFALHRLAELKAELLRPLRWIRQHEGLTPPEIPHGSCA